MSKVDKGFSIIISFHNEFRGLFPLPQLKWGWENPEGIVDVTSSNPCGVWEYRMGVAGRTIIPIEKRWTRDHYWNIESSPALSDISYRIKRHVRVAYINNNWNKAVENKGSVVNKEV